MALKRLCAQIIDTLIYLVLSYIPLIVISLLGGLLTLANRDITSVVIMVTTSIGTLLVPVTFGYLNYIWLKKYSATIGYRMMHLEIVNVDDSKLSTNQAVKRAIFKSVYLILLFVIIVGILHGVILFQTNGKEDVLDKISNTKCRTA
jgi:uncharacterized RDD family membrane protein YckC